jgi:hypothetical protein
VNAVRLHKFIPPGGGGIGDERDSTKFNPEMLERFDAFTAELKKRGIYYGFSWVFDHKLRPEDKKRIKGYDEIMAAGGDTSRVAVFVARDVQDLRMDMLKALLAHKNPYTGLTYAQDPGLAYIEMHNEDSIFFYTFQGLMTSLPTYRAEFTQRFNQFLREKYKDQAGLVAAWGEKALNKFDFSNESLEAGTIGVQANPWFFSPEGLKQGKAQGTYQRLLDTAAFLHFAQGEFYQRFKGAIREAGYKGPLVGSCWTTPAGLPQYLNLHNDYQVGMIDRHTYFGGKGGWKAEAGEFDNSAQVDRVASGILTQGFLQVADRPFSLSEWTTVYPNQWAPESTFIVAAYGMGLQGWDASYQFASSSNEYRDHVFARTTHDPRLWVVDQPANLGLYPALARMLYRGDVKEGPVVSRRRVTLADLLKDKPEWLSRESTKQAGDVKEFGTAVSSELLAAGRVVVEFGPDDAGAKGSELGDVKQYVGEDGTVMSATGQLAWTPARKVGERGHIVLDTEGTKGFVGFVPASGKVEFKGVSVRMEPGRFVTLLMTPTERNASFADTKSLLVTLMGRTRDTGEEMSEDGKRLVKPGRAPIEIEGVRATIELAERPALKVNILDHDGRRTTLSHVPKDGHVLELESGKLKSMYFEVMLK